MDPFSSADTETTGTDLGLEHLGKGLIDLAVTVIVLVVAAFFEGLREAIGLRPDADLIPGKVNTRFSARCNGLGNGPKP